MDDIDLNRLPNVAAPEAAEARAVPPAPPRHVRVEIDRAYLRRRHIFVAPDDDGSKIAISAFKSLRTHMLKALRAKGVCHLAVTGTTKDVGKSTVAANLAVNFARHKGTHVTLVDLDLRAPSIAALFGLAPRRGIDDVTRDGFRLQDALLHTDIPGLSILPCLRSHDNSTEILLSDEMRALLTVLLESRPDRVVVFDAPPVLGCDDVVALASLLDSFLLVVGEHETTRRELRDVMNVLADADILAVVLNKSRQTAFKRYYY